MINKIRKKANWGLYGSIGVVIPTLVFHFCPYKFAPQTETVQRWMLLSGTVLVVLAIVAVLMLVRRTTPAIRQMEGGVDAKLKAYASYISSLYTTTLGIVVAECVLMVLMSDTVLLMPTILLVLVLFLCYPNMYKMKNDLGLTDEEMQSLFGSDNIASPQPAEAGPDLVLADAQLEREAEKAADETSSIALEEPSVEISETPSEMPEVPSGGAASNPEKK